MIWKILATWFGSGLSPKAPGTCGTIAALPFAAAITYFAGPWGLAVASVLVFFIGWLASNRYMEISGSGHDPGEIVIDEVAGVWIALLPAGLNPIGFLVGFILFRVFDILKPWPIGWLDEKVGGGLGVMLDDVAAGIVAAIGVWLLSGYLY